MKLTRTIKNLQRRTLRSISRIYNALLDLNPSKRQVSPHSRELNEVYKCSLARTGINDHLVTLFSESLSIEPRLIVELGVRRGESTFVLERVARLCGSTLISVDIDDCSGVSSFEDWIFVQKDDIEFAKGFAKWCENRQIQPHIDVLFIDTNHLFEHTVQEIKFWFPFLSDKSKVFFHDTNLKSVCFRKDGSMGLGWDNDRGVIRALEEFFTASFNEKKDFVDFKNGWLIKHYSLCNGFTVLEKIQCVNTSSPMEVGVITSL